MSTLNADFGRLYKGPTRATYSGLIVLSARTDKLLQAQRTPRKTNSPPSCGHAGH